jgi:hypothetical protein
MHIVESNVDSSLFTRLLDKEICYDNNIPKDELLSNHDKTTNT